MCWRGRQERFDLDQREVRTLRSTEEPKPLEAEGDGPSEFLRPVGAQLRCGEGAIGLLHEAGGGEAALGRGRQPQRREGIVQSCLQVPSPLPEPGAEVVGTGARRSRSDAAVQVSQGKIARAQKLVNRRPDQQHAGLVGLLLGHHGQVSKSPDRLTRADPEVGASEEQFDVPRGGRDSGVEASQALGEPLVCGRGSSKEEHEEGSQNAHEPSSIGRIGAEPRTIARLNTFTTARADLHHMASSGTSSWRPSGPASFQFQGRCNRSARPTVVWDMMRLTLLFACSLLTFTSACASLDEMAPPITDCDADHPMVGSTAELTEHFHGVAGTAVIIDNCTIEIQDFEFDGGGVDVHVVVADNPDFDDYDNLTENLRAADPYEGATLTIPLREGMSLDDVTHISVWCVPFSASFGDGAFEPGELT